MSRTTLYDDAFTYNSANQISQIAGLSTTKNVTYDYVNRLTGVTVGGSAVESYAYDAVGNRTASHLSSAYTNGPVNRLTATNTASYSYNANGSMSGKTVGATNWTFGWDGESRMISAGDGTSTASYQYDALGRRVKRTQGSNVQKYSYDGSDVVLDDVNSVVTKYQNGLGTDSKQEAETSSTSEYFLGDHLGSSVALASSSGSITDSNAYDSFGNPTNGSFSSRYEFTGREFDAFSGLQYSRARWYDPSIGRFISEDPIGFAGGDVNFYVYVGNQPAQYIDPFGQFPSWYPPLDYHQQITKKALDGLADPRDIQSISDANARFDAGSQDDQLAPEHAMRSVGQGVPGARASANEFVRNRICLARKLESQGLHADAMNAIGAATHTVQDAESPAHRGFQEAWPNTPIHIALNLGHYIRESFFYSHDDMQRADNSTRRVWAYFKGFPLPTDFFDPNGEQQPCDCPQ